MSDGQLSQRRSMIAAGVVSALLQTRQRGVGAARPPRLVRRVSACECGAMPLRNRDGRRLCRATRGARQRPAERQMHSRPCDSDVEQAAFLLDRLAVGAVGQRVRDRQRAVGQPDQEHRVPLQTLGRVQRRQRDALHHRWVPGVGALPQARRAARAGRATAVRHLVVDEFGQRVERLPALSGLGARRRLRRSGPAARAAARTNGGSRRPTRRRRARPRAAARAAPAGSPGG